MFERKSTGGCCRSCIRAKNDISQHRENKPWHKVECLRERGPPGPYNNNNNNDTFYIIISITCARAIRVCEVRAIAIGSKGGTNVQLNIIYRVSSVD